MIGNMRYNVRREGSKLCGFALRKGFFLSGAVQVIRINGTSNDFKIEAVLQRYVIFLT